MGNDNEWTNKNGRVITEPVWHDVEDLSLVRRFGFTKEDFS